MQPYPEKKPRKGQIVVAYLPDGDFYIARYTKVLTWTGRKVKFVNLQSNGFWRNNVVGWNRIPQAEDTI